MLALTTYTLSLLALGLFVGSAKLRLGCGLAALVLCSWMLWR